MTFTDLYYVLAVVEEGSITRAAQKLFVSQPALSQRVQKVETELQTTLFTRTASGLEITQPGLLFRAMAQDVLSVYEQFQNDLKITAKNLASQISVGIPPNQSRILVPSLAELFFDAHPEIQLSFRTGNSGWIEEKILSGELDLGVIHNPSYDRRIAHRVLYKIPIRIYLRKNSPVAARARNKRGHRYPVLCLQDIKDEPIGVTLPGMQTRLIIDNCFKKEGVTPNLSQEMSSFDSLTSLADSGICTLLQPMSDENASLHDRTRIFDIDSEFEMALDIVLGYRSDTPFLKPYETIYEVLQERHKLI